jgi:hypothetical protein
MLLLLMLQEEDHRTRKRPVSDHRPSSLRPALQSPYQKPGFLELGPVASEPESKELAPMIELQIETEKLFHRNQLFPRIKAEFLACAKPDFRKRMLDHRIDPDFGFDLLVQMALHKRAGLPVLVGILRKHFKGDSLCSQRTADELLKAAEADLVDWDPLTRQFVVKYEMSQDVQDDLDRYQYPLPMVVEPRELKTNHDTGYYTSCNSVILRDNHHELDVCLDHLNRMNRIRFRIDVQVAQTIQHRWKSLDKPKPDEELDDYRRRVKAFEKYDRTVHDVLFHLNLATGNEFYLTHKYDKRGRSYCQGYHVNYQGATWNKAVVTFADAEVVQ